jgi:hypothetical protein
LPARQGRQRASAWIGPLYGYPPDGSGGAGATVAKEYDIAVAVPVCSGVEI